MIRFRHFHHTATLAYDLDVGVAGLAICSSSDRFSLKAGRTVAMFRLHQALLFKNMNNLISKEIVDELHWLGEMVFFMPEVRYQGD